jgi:hypothetical protein
MPGRRASPSFVPAAASRRAHEPCPAQMLWAPLPLPAVAPNDVLRLANASTVSIARLAPPRQRRGHHRCCRPTTASAASVSFARAASSASKLSTARSARSASTGRNVRPLLPLCGGRHERGRRPLPRAWTAAAELSAGSVLHDVPEMQRPATTCAPKPQVPRHHHRARRCSRRVQPLRLDRRPAGARIAAPSSAGMASPGRQATLAAAGGRRSRAAAW